MSNDPNQPKISIFFEQGKKELGTPIGKLKESKVPIESSSKKRKFDQFNSRENKQFGLKNENSISQDGSIDTLFDDLKIEESKKV